MDALNSVKLDLAAAVSACVSAVLLMAALPLERWLEVTVLGLTALAAATWVMVRTRRVVRDLRQSMGNDGGDGTQHE